MAPTMSVSRPVAIASVSLVAVLLYLSVSTLQGPGRRTTTMQQWSPLQPAPASAELNAQVQALRERVLKLEGLLQANLVQAGQTSRRKVDAAEGGRVALANSQVAQSTAAPAKDDPRIAAFEREKQEREAPKPVTPAAVAPVMELTILPRAVSNSEGMQKRTTPAWPTGVVPRASWWSDSETQRAGSPLWCPEPPPYAALKPELKTLAPVDDKPRLTAALAKKHASRDNMLIVTYVNFHRLDFVYTLVKHLIALNNPNYLIGALDEEALRGLQQHGIPCFFMDSGLTTKDYGWGTYAFRQLGLHKVNLVYELAATGVDCLTIDADALIFRDPFPYLRKYANADVLMSSDHLVATNGYKDDGLEDSAAFSSAFNIGYIFIRGRAVEFVARWRKTCFERKNDWDQVLFAQVLRHGAGFGGKLDELRLRKMYKTENGTNLLAGVLPVSLFASGHTFFVSRMAHLMQAHPYMVHTTFQYGGAQGKRHRLRESMMWEDSEDYYSGPKFLSYELDLPYELVYPNGGELRPDGTQPFAKRMSVEQHFKLLHHQLRQLRNAFALAKKLNRIVILPRLVCGLDRWWAPHAGIIPGSAARLPLLDCPADHVIDLERMGQPERILREHTMLCNPRTPKRVLEGLRTVVLPALALPAAGRASTEGLALVERLAKEHAEATVLSVKSALPDYRTILHVNELERFERDMAGHGGLWCCNRPPGGRGAGHIWYDFLADVIPHRDRHNRKWDSEWKAIMGP